MNELEINKDIIVGFFHNYKKGDKLYYKYSTYCDSLQEWTVDLYRKVGNYLKLSGTIRVSCLDKAKEENKKIEIL